MLKNLFDRMPTTLMIGIVFVLICIVYGLASHAYTRKETVYGTEAGPLCQCAVLENSTERVRTFRLPTGQYDSTRHYIRIRICGSCMTPRKILNGEEWLVKPIDGKRDLAHQIKPKDVLFLYIADRNIYKIREFRGFASDGRLRTGRYESDGTWHDSSQPHTVGQVMGILKYSI